jgi:hypothetical protein
MYQVIDPNVTLEKAVEYLVLKINGIQKSIMETAKEFVMYCEAFPNIIDELLDRNIPRTLLTTLDGIGRGKIYEGLLFESGSQYRRLQKCPISEQEKYFNQPIAVVLADGDKLNIKIENLTPAQAKQVFANDHVRTDAEQRAYLESLKTDYAVKAVINMAEKPKYICDKEGIVTRDGLRITKSELLDIVQKMMKA